jgi:fused-like protein
MAALVGAPCSTGLFDGVVALMGALLSYGPGADATLAGLQAGWGDALVSLLLNGRGSPGPLAELSPHGLQQMLTALLHTVQADANAAKALCADASLPTLLVLLGERHMGLLSAWPDAGGGGAVAVARAVHGVLELLQLPLNSVVGEGGVESLAAPAGYQEALLNQGAMALMVPAMDALTGDELLLPVNLVSRLVLSSASFAQQFVDAGGLAPGVIQRLLAEGNPPTVLVDVLLVASQLARISKEGFNTYEAISRAAIYPHIRKLLVHPDPGVRARVCNLIGNMCRHSAYFYGALDRHALIQPLIDRCADPDKSTRKFACFAIGNAGFHNASLYEALKPSIASLVALLRDEEDKTRANAAGALGNLVRNSSALCGELTRAGALRALLDTALSPERPASGRPGSGSSSSSASDGGSPVKIALFSLGNMCAHKECREALWPLGVQDVLRRLSSTHDAVTQKYLQRITSKLQAGGGGPGTPQAGAK